MIGKVCQYTHCVCTLTNQFFSVVYAGGMTIKAIREQVSSTLIIVCVYGIIKAYAW